MSASQLLVEYNKAVKQLATIYNTNVSAILKLSIKNAIKQNYLKNLKVQLQKNLANLKAKYDADLLLLNKPAATNKKALLIGINYNGTSAQLNGCINDINSVSAILTTKYAFNTITKITDETTQKPTRDVILASFAQFLKSGVEGDVLFFSFSGHGSTTLDRNNDEKNGTSETGTSETGTSETGTSETGNDEMIIASDLKGILDDELKSLIQTNLKKNVTLFALFDSCFSGTVLDLKYQYLDSLANDASTVNNNDSETIGNVIMISGCSDAQTSADAYIDKKYQGAMTWAFISVMTALTTKPSWRDLLVKMRDKLKTSQFTQLPQLSSGCFMDINNVVCF
jgi:hypothetical protein